MNIHFKNRKSIYVMIFVLIAFITIGLGYAAISAVNLSVNGIGNISANQNNFSVVFKSASVTTGTGTASIDSNDSTVAYFDITGLSETGDSATATYTIKNESDGVGANITLKVTNSDSEYFQVTERVLDTSLQANEQTTATITVEMIKTPTSEAVTTSIVGTLTATPIDNTTATGSASATATPIPSPSYKYSTSYNNIGDSLVGEQPSFVAAKTAFGYPVSQAHILNNGVIAESYIAYEMNNQIYYFRGCVDENRSPTTPIYDANVATIKEVYGLNWDNYCTDDTYEFYCSDGQVEMTINIYGEIDISTSSWSCSTDSTGVSQCYHY